MEFSSSSSGKQRYKREESKAGEPSVRLQIVPQRTIGSGDFADNLGGSFFEPQREPSDNTPSGGGGGGGGGGGSGDRNTSYAALKAPEKELTLFALRLAVLEKAASGIGKLAFIWATVVLLGGFAITLEKEDFWFVSVILVTESIRIFGRSHELEWQHQATSSLADAGRYSFQALVSSSRLLFRAIKAIFRPFSAIQSKTRHIADDIQTIQEPQNHALPYEARQTWRPSADIPLFPYPGWLFLSKNVSRILDWLQVLSALACMTLSLMRLIQQDYGEVRPEDTEKRNRKSALDIFYSLALAEALMFFVEKVYWQWTINVRKLIEKVNRQCDLGPSGMVSIRRFFYDAYSRCINGSIFDGLKMDLVSFAEELLGSDSQDEQLMGAGILNKFVTSGRFSAETLRKIGTSTPAIERLIEMLNWKNPAEEKIRRSAAEIVSKLAGRKQNALRVASIPGATESISSLLSTGRSSDAKPYEIWDRSILVDQENYEFSAFNVLGLLILKKLASDHDNCFKIGSARGLLAKIIDFTSTGERVLRNDLVTESQIKLVKRSLQLVKLLASTTGPTGKMLRQEIAEIVFTVSNIRELLEHGENHMMLQKLGIEVLTSLAMDETAKERIGSTGGVVKLLLCILFKPGLTEKQNSVRIEAGEALAMLTLESEKNCHRVLKGGDVMDQLVAALKEPILRINSSRILRNLCAYSGHESFNSLRRVAAAIPTVLNTIMMKEKKQLEVTIGLAAQIFKFTSLEEYDEELQRAGITDAAFAEKLVQILREYNYPDIKVPRMRRFVILLAIWMMKSHTKYIQLFRKLSMEEVLKHVAETTSELECFNVFSGSVGLSRHKLTIYSLIDTALDLIAEG